MDKKIIRELRAVLGRENLLTEPEDLVCYSFDGSGSCQPPQAVALPGSSEEVAAVLAIASRYAVAVVPRGAGSGMTGGSLPVHGGLVLVFTRMNRVLEIDADNMVAVVQPGLITGEFQDVLRKKGLYYPVDPASLKFCTMGGNAAECAGGSSAVKYGVTKDYIIGCEAVLATGEVIKTGVRTEKGVAGYDLTRLLVGSEGTLAVFTSLVVRLLPLPEAKKTFLLLFSSILDATGLVAKILRTSLVPCTLEYMDQTAIEVVRDRLDKPLPDGVSALLLLELDGSCQQVEEDSERLLSFLKLNKVLVQQAKTEGERQQLWLARRSISPATFSLKPDKISEDVVVPRTKIPDLVDFAHGLAVKLSLIILTFGHAGDGNIHVNIMVDKNDKDEYDRGLAAKGELFAAVIGMGGTLSGEHGIGTTKSDFLSLEINPATMQLMGRIKQLFDPDNILNPGKIFPDRS
jgi:glycolate oxidase